jgi:hypothetical protein
MEFGVHLPLISIAGELTQGVCDVAFRRNGAHLSC